MSKILIIDDEKSILRILKDILEHEQYDIDTVQEAISAVKMINDNKYDLILSDVKMPKMSGLELLEHIYEKNVKVPVIMMSGYGTIDMAVEAVKKGAFDFISKPPDLNRLLITIRNALDKNELLEKTGKESTKTSRKSKLRATKVVKFKKDIIGDSPGIMRVKNTIQKVAPTEARVLITGENGTGKELVAHQIHKLSGRSSMPIVEVNCAAIPSELIESELFGHEKGSFTSALKQRIGKFEQANNGTLFLDEIGDMSLSAQAKMLRALQEHKITRVGGDKEIQVNVRVLAATNKNLLEEVEAKKFRLDLYHRLSVIEIKVPPLRERKTDITLLVDNFVEVICNEYGIESKKVTPLAIKKLEDKDWYGNIRELRNIVERLVILSEDEISEKEVMAYC